MMRSRRGVFLFAITGLLALLLVLGLSFLQLARSGRGAASGRLRGLWEGLAAESAMEYAFARLARDAMPRFSVSAADRGDDWTCRDPAGTPLDAMRNPSYAHGEAWIEGSAVPDGLDNDGDEEIDEPGEVDRIFVAGEAFPDSDGDGKRSAWSGRVRGGGMGDGLPFTLRIGSDDGKLPVNAGWLWEWNLDGENGRPNLEPGTALPLPDHRDAAANIPIASALDGLGSILLGRPALGQDLIRRRPVGGYRSIEELRQELGPPAGPYTAAELDAVEPYLDLGPYGLPAGGRSHLRSAIRVAYPYVPVNLWTADRPVLESLWRGLTAARPAWRQKMIPPQVLYLAADDYPDEQAGWNALWIRSGKLFMDLIRISPAEAGRLADAARLFRQEGRCSWLAFRSRLNGRARTIFREEFDAIEGAGAHLLKWSWAAAKANLAFQAAAMDPYPGNGDVVAAGGVPAERTPEHSALWATWGIDANPDVPGTQPVPAVRIVPESRQGRTQGLTLAPPQRFTVEGRALGALRSGRLRTGERIEAASQQDFEIWLGERCEATWTGAEWSGSSSVKTVDSPSAQVRRDAPSGRRPRTVTLPRWNRRSLNDPSEDNDSADGPPPPVSPYNWGIECKDMDQPLKYGFSRTYGAVGLGTAEAGIGSAELYWPFTEDFDPPDIVPPAPPWREFWSVFKANPVPAWQELWVDPPFRLEPDLSSVESEPLCMSPYGFTNGVRTWKAARMTKGPFNEGPIVSIRGCSTWSNPAWGHRNEHRPQVGPPGFAPTPPRWDPGDPLLGFTIEARMGIGSEIRIQKDAGGGTLTLSTRRGRRGASTFGTELTVTADLRITKGGGYRAWKSRSWLVPDSDRKGAWSHSVRLSLERVDSGIPMLPEDLLPDDPPGRTYMKTKMSLLVNGSPASADGPMSFLFDGKESPIPPAYGPRPLEYPETECGEIAKTSKYMTGFYKGIDELKMYDSPAPVVSIGPRYLPEGTFLSPLYVPDLPADLDRAQWTGVFPPAGGIEAGVVAYRDAAGTDVLGTVPLGPAEGTAGLSSLRGARSFRYVVKLKGDPSVDEPPIFESIWISLRRRGVSPVWTAWSGG